VRVRVRMRVHVRVRVRVRVSVRAFARMHGAVRLRKPSVPFHGTLKRSVSLSWHSSQVFFLLSPFFLQEHFQTLQREKQAQNTYRAHFPQVFRRKAR